MRYAIDPTSPDHDPEIDHCVLHVMLDGKFQPLAVGFDSEEGWVDRIALDTRGKTLPDPANMDKALVERAFGKVVVIYHGEPKPKQGA